MRGGGSGGGGGGGDGGGGGGRGGCGGGKMCKRRGGERGQDKRVLFFHNKNTYCSLFFPFSLSLYLFFSLLSKPSPDC